MDFMSLSQEMFDVYFSAEQQVTPVITRDDLKNDLVACPVSADLLILTYYFQNIT